MMRVVLQQLRSSLKLHVRLTIEPVYAVLHRAQLFSRLTIEPVDAVLHRAQRFGLAHHPVYDWITRS